MAARAGRKPELVRQKSLLVVHGRSPLHFAALKGDIDIMRVLVQNKADVNRQDWDHCTPLHYCAVVGFIEGAKVLLDAGSHINAETRMKETPLIFALGTKQLEMVNFLISARADVNQTGLHRKTPLFFVTDTECATLLIKAGADVNFQDDEESTPLHEAAKEGHVDVGRVLIEHGAKVNAVNNHKQTPLHVAAEKGRPLMCEILLNNGAELKALDVARRNAEMLARRNEHYDVLAVISKFQAATDDDEAPLLFFKPFSGVLNSSKPPEGSVAADIKPGEFKFNMAPT